MINVTEKLDAIFASLTANDAERYKTTDKFLVVRYNDYRRRMNDRGDESSGPAYVYFDKASITSTAAHYGWTINKLPPDSFWTILNDLQPARVRYL